MDLEHEYTVLGGINRVTVGRYLSAAAAFLSSAIVLFILTLVDIAKKFGLPANVPPSLFSLLGAGTIFVFLYWLLSRFVWRWPYVSFFLKVPNLAGKWACVGQTLNPDGSKKFDWAGEVIIIQDWDKIRVRLKTNESTSNSITAALLCDEIDGYRLLYNYRNRPAISHAELDSHVGFAELLFSKDRQTAEGEYFNGHGRFTFGTMQLTRL